MSSLAKELAKSKIESQNARTSPWSAEIWKAAGEAFLSGEESPPPRFRIAISQDSLISSAEKLQQLADLPTLPEIETTRTAPRRDATEGEPISVWFGGTRRDAWVAKSLKAMPENADIEVRTLSIEEKKEIISKRPASPWPAEAWEAARALPEPRFPIIISEDGLFSTIERLRELVDLPSSLEVETTTISPAPWEDASTPPGDGKEVQFCDVDYDVNSKIEDLTEGESIFVWFKGTISKDKQCYDDEPPANGEEVQICEVNEN
ncbi:hypothetical protein V492_06267 [Pseudogymnoascus sp. VKM F-4246]|nr:hypothetical protein V492_06267 [Pseudogymnoascus sp. VKM F-4246]